MDANANSIKTKEERILMGKDFVQKYAIFALDNKNYLLLQGHKNQSLT